MSATPHPQPSGACEVSILLNPFWLRGPAVPSGLHGARLDGSSYTDHPSSRMLKQLLENGNVGIFFFLIKHTIMKH